ncbi:Protein smg8 [Branchiostoma belcheri]|nr:Protein smg8 [Branchiostoma belcheri]
MTEMKWSEVWRLPFVGDLEELPFKDDKVCVVGMFGKSQVGYGTKSTTINTVLDREVFPLHWPDGAGLQSQEDTYIEAFYDKSKNVIYLHLVSVFDTSMLVSLCGKLDRDLPYADVHKFWRDQELRHARGLLFLFHVCHILVALHPTCTFDMTYGQLLRTVDSIRLKMLPVLQEVLRDAPVGAEWKSAGRSCTPRLLFVFQRSCLPTGSDAHAETGKSKGTKHSPKKRLQHRIEDQIYRIFRKSRLLTNQSKDCLFTVPPNQTFVYIQSRAGPVDAINTLLSNLHQTCALGKEAEVHTSRSYSMSRRTNQSTTINPPSILLPAKPTGADDSLLGFLRTNQSTTINPPSILLPAKPNSADDSLLGFLWQHVELVLSGKGFDDSVGRNPQPSHFELPHQTVNLQPSHFELPTCGKWLTVCNMLHELLLTESGQNAKVESSLESMGSSLDVETKFSDSRCSKVLPLASSAYQNNLPSHYTSKVHNNQLGQVLKVHNNQLGQALKVFKQHARGPAYDHYVLQLQEDCEKFWANGRQLCEERSLTGQHCVHPFHTLPKPGQPSDPEPTDSQVVPCMPHNSRARSLCACNCGRKQAQRDDPFDVKAANHDFFSLMEEKCCSSLEHISFPVFQRQPQGTPGEDTNPPEEDPPPTLQPEDAAPMSEEEPHPTLQPEPEVSMKTDPEPSKRKDSVLSSATTTASGGLSLALSLASFAVLLAARVDLLQREFCHGEKVSRSNKTASSRRLKRVFGNALFSRRLEAVLLERETFSPWQKLPRQQIVPRGRILLALLREKITPTPNKTAKEASMFGCPGQSGGSDMFVSMLHADQNSDSLAAVGMDGMMAADNQQQEAEAEKTAQLVRQPSVTESLPGMLHSDCPPGVLPKYSSWELVCLGPAGLYYPSLGLEQPGFIHGSNLLLAWDIPIHTERPQQGDQAWPAPGESQTVRRSIPHGGKPRRGAKDSDSFVRVYVGYEYECARGHRFLCSGPDKVMKTSTSGAVKETALKLLSMDMPLYFPCPCPSRGAKPHLGQLMRVFLTTPDPPVQIHLHPRLQPGPPPCPTFYPQEEDIPLPPSRLWVLRLPFVYVGEAGVISPPRDSQPLLSCKVLKGLLKATIVEEEEVLAH